MPKITRASAWVTGIEPPYPRGPERPVSPRSTPDHLVTARDPERLAAERLATDRGARVRRLHGHRAQAGRDHDLHRARFRELLRREASVVEGEDLGGRPSSASLPVGAPLHHAHAVAPPATRDDQAPWVRGDAEPARRDRDREPVARVPAGHQAGRPRVHGVAQAAGIDRAALSAPDDAHRRAVDGGLGDRGAVRPRARRPQHGREVVDRQRHLPSRERRRAVVALGDRAQVGKRRAPEDLVVAVRPPVRGGEVDGVRRASAEEQDLPAGLAHGAVPARHAGRARMRDASVDLAVGGAADRRVQRLALPPGPPGPREHVAARGDHLGLERRRRPARRHLGDALEVLLERDRHRRRERAVVVGADREGARVVAFERRPFGVHASRRAPRVGASYPERAVARSADRHAGRAEIEPVRRRRWW